MFFAFGSKIIEIKPIHIVLALVTIALVVCAIIILPLEKEATLETAKSFDTITSIGNDDGVIVSGVVTQSRDANSKEDYTSNNIEEQQKEQKREEQKREEQKQQKQKEVISESWQVKIARGDFSDFSDCSFDGKGHDAVLMPSGFYYCRSNEKRVSIELRGIEKICCVIP